jgi:two-component system cell cycle sensor histidine kinase/response regulator CckA
MGPIQTSPSMRTTVLLVDDEDFLRRLLSRMLLEAGFTVVDAENGKRALEIARALDGELGLVVTDLHMPVMGGLEFAREFRSFHPLVPILFISGRDLPEHPVSPDGWDGNLLRKPFGTEVFLEAVARTLAGSRDAMESARGMGRTT